MPLVAAAPIIAWRLARMHLSGWLLLGSAIFLTALLVQVMPAKAKPPGFWTTAGGILAGIIAGLFCNNLILFGSSMGMPVEPLFFILIGVVAPLGAATGIMRILTCRMTSPPTWVITGILVVLGALPLSLLFQRLYLPAEQFFLLPASGKVFVGLSLWLPYPPLLFLAIIPAALILGGTASCHSNDSPTVTSGGA